MTKRSQTVRQDLFQISVGRRLAILRSDAGMSQRDVAEVVGQHRNTICRWEKGVFTLDVWSMVLLAAAIGMEPAQLMEILVNDSKPARLPAEIRAKRNDGAKRKSPAS